MPGATLAHQPTELDHVLDANHSPQPASESWPIGFSASPTLCRSRLSLGRVERAQSSSAPLKLSQHFFISILQKIIGSTVEQGLQRLPEKVSGLLVIVTLSSNSLAGCRRNKGLSLYVAFLAGKKTTMVSIFDHSDKLLAKGVIEYQIISIYCIK